MNLYAEISRAPFLRNEKVPFENYQTLKNCFYILYEIERNIQTKQTNKQTNTFHTNQTPDTCYFHLKLKRTNFHISRWTMNHTNYSYHLVRM